MTTGSAERLVEYGQGNICPAQVLRASVTELEPVKRLMLAVLERAVVDYRTYATVPTARARRLFTEIDAWFRSPAGGPFDFETICHATGLDPDFVRKGLPSADGLGRRQRSIGVAQRGIGMDIPPSGFAAVRAEGAGAARQTPRAGSTPRFVSRPPRNGPRTSRIGRARWSDAGRRARKSH
jgi:hypothetical protein